MTLGILLHVLISLGSRHMRTAVLLSVAQYSSVLSAPAPLGLSRFTAVFLGMIVLEELLLRMLNLDSCSVMVVSCP